MSFSFDKQHVILLKNSRDIVGYLQPAIREKGTDKILVGRHRKFADPNWPEVELEIKDELQRELVIIHGQVQRGISEEEAKARLLRIAQVLVSKDLEPAKVCSYIVEKNLLPWSESYIQRLLPKEYKMGTVPGKSRTASTSPQPLTLEHSKTDLNIQELSGNQLEFPFPDCKCSTCPNKNKCY